MASRAYAFLALDGLEHHRALLQRVQSEVVAAADADASVELQGHTTALFISCWLGGGVTASSVRTGKVSADKVSLQNVQRTDAGGGSPEQGLQASLLGPGSGPSAAPVHTQPLPSTHNTHLVA